MKLIGIGLLILSAVMSVNAVLVTVYDKRAAIRHEKRIPEKTLLTAAALFGAAAMFMTMILIRHKTRHNLFMVGLPLMALAQGIVITLFILL